MAAAAASRVMGTKLALREIHIIMRLCQRSPDSQGVRDFIQQRYVELKKVHPKLWACYAFGQEKNVSLNNLSVDEVTRSLENVRSGKA
uniref:NADH dehydrogenase [ubiquinone] 1 alpha subcomplex subunit 2 n=1 Tax=Cricetulus griseus TaxID=10029 RepID=A0A8C2LY47_CRIGR